MKVKIFHNPRCSKSRETLKLVEENTDSYDIIEYLKNPPTKTELKKIIKMLGGDAHAAIRPKEAEYKLCNLSKDASSEAVIDAIIEHPKLLERPIVVVDNKAAIGRPPENVLALFKA